MAGGREYREKARSILYEWKKKGMPLALGVLIG